MPDESVRDAAIQLLADLDKLTADAEALDADTAQLLRNIRRVVAQICVPVIDIEKR